MAAWWLFDGDERRNRLEREGGWRAIVVRELRNRFLRARRHGHPTVYVGTLSSPPRPTLPPGLRIERFEGAEWDRLRPLAGRRSRELFRRRAAAGRIAVVAWRGERPVGICWLASRVEPALEGQSIALEPDTVYVYGLFVVPTERRAGFGCAITEAAVRLASELGYHRYCIVLYGGNVAAVRSAHRALGPLEEWALAAGQGT